MKLPSCSFFLFGMGNRKFLYRSGSLLDALTGEIIKNWNVVSESIHVPEYRVELGVSGGTDIVIAEDEKGVWLDKGERKTCLSKGHLKLPSFSGHDRPIIYNRHKLIGD